MSVAAAGCGAIPPPAVPYQRVKDSLDAWEKIGAGPVILNWIKNGYKLPFIKRLKPFKYPPLIHSQEETAALQEILEKLLAIGAVEVTADDSFVSRSQPTTALCQGQDWSPRRTAVIDSWWTCAM